MAETFRSKAAVYTISSEGYRSKWRGRKQHLYKVPLTHGFNISTSINMLQKINWANKMNHVINIIKGRKEGRKGGRERGRERKWRKIQYTLISQHLFLLNLLVKWIENKFIIWLLFKKIVCACFRKIYTKISKDAGMDNM